MSDELKLCFFVNDTEYVVDGGRAGTTVLHYLRNDLALMGTKEGCSEGDCGACTVLLADSSSGQPLYRPVNACITPLGLMHGQSITTVEGLSEDGELSPVQQAMCDAGASQCGFCTVGFVMALTALFCEDANPDEDTIHAALAGNLCRCTGYRPILDAARKLTDGSSGGKDGRVLRAHRPSRRVGAKGLPSHPVDWQSLSDAVAAQPDAILIAGGTDIVASRHGDMADESFIWIGDVDCLNQVERDAAHIDIGAAVTLATTGEILTEEYPELLEIVRRIASPAITRAGTIGGNLASASPLGDYIPVLIALDANVKLRLRNEARWLPLQELYRGYRETCLRPGELIVTVRVPRRRPEQFVGAYKIAKRFEQDTTTLLGAFSIVLDGELVAAARISFGGMSAIHGRAVAMERALLDRPWSDTIVAAAVRELPLDYQPISDLRGTSEYRLTAAANLLHKFYLQTTTETSVSLWKTGRKT